MNKFQGIGASNGIATAKAYLLKDDMPDVKKVTVEDSEKELNIFKDAILLASKQIEKLKEDAFKNIGPEKAAVFDAHLGILNDPELFSQVKTKIETEKINSAFALYEVAEIFKNLFLSMDDDYMKERASDVSDVTTRIIKIIEGVEIKDLSLINEEVIIIAHDLTPSETSQLNDKYVKGFITEIGGRTSHSAIMARSLEIPAVVGAGAQVFDIKEQEDLLMDGNLGEVLINPDESSINEFKARASKLEKLKEEQQKFKTLKTVSKDGWHTEVAANIGSPSDIEGVLNNGAEGIGLFRTEFLYMGADNWPNEEKQFESYKKVLQAVNGQKVVIRTLDIGGDKKLSYFSFPEELNPFLGYRAIRFQLDNDEILNAQFRALLRASEFGKLAIDIPMVATIDEMREVKAHFKRLEEELKSEGKEIGEYELGIMVEIPATVEQADKFAKYSDFFSIGTNDLIQYTFAADRMSEKVSYLYQPFNPALLRKIKKVIDASHVEGKWTAICGEVAGEPMLTAVLVGMGLDEFSMSASSVLEIRSLISKIDKSEAEKLVDIVLDAETQNEVKEIISSWYKEKGIEV